MSAPWPHVHVSEREGAHRWPNGRWDDAAWEDCLWCAIVEWLNDTWKNVPDTLAYAEKIRAASGEPPTGGSNFGDVQRGFNKLGIAITLKPLRIDAFATALKPGTAAVATGSMGNFPKTHRLRRWDTSFSGGHAVYVARLKNNTLWWCDPLAPKGTYQGEAITGSQLRVFMGSAWTGVVRPVRKEPAIPDTESDMIALRTYLPGYTANIKPASNVRAEPKISATRLFTTGTTKKPATVIGTVTGDRDPANGSTVWYELWVDGKRVYTATDNVLDVKAPATAVDDGYTKATQDAAVLATATASKAAATKAERERIALAEADRIRKT